MRVLLVGPVEHQRGGMSRYVSQLETHLADDVQVDTHHVGSNEDDGIPGAARAAVDSVVRAIEFALMDPPDLVHVHASYGFDFYRALFYAQFADRVWNCPVLFHIHGSAFDKFAESDSTLANRALLSAYDVADHMLVISDYSKDLLPDEVCDNVSVIHHAVDPDDYEPTDDDHQFVFLSDLIERKGVSELLEAIERSGITSEFVIAGTGPLEDEVRSFAQSHDNVTYRGFVSEAEKHELLSESSVYVLPTYSEAGPPIAVVEGMAGGNAILTTTTSGIGELVEDDFGRMIDPVETDELAAALADFDRDPATAVRMGQRARELVEETYNWENNSEAVLAEYQRCVGGNERRVDDPVGTASVN